MALTKFDNDTLEYSTDSHLPQFAVFSEIYYPFGWNAYLDGKKVDYVKTDYTLRGLSVPAGKHTVKFIFEPSSYKKGVTIWLCSFMAYYPARSWRLLYAWRQQSGKKYKQNNS
ncbi:MAG: YfhO family protein [Bacteroidota bacterium]